MNKKNIGAALSLIAAVTAGATAYASTVNNLGSDKNTNSMISPSYTENNDYVSFIQADYTKDLKNTAIAKEKRIHKTTKDDEEKIAKIEEAANKIVAEKLISIEETTYEDEETADVEDEDIVSAEEEVSEEEVAVNDEVDDNQLVVYEDVNLDSAIENINEEDLVENEQSDIDSQVEYLDSNEAVSTEAESNDPVINESENQADESNAEVIEETPAEIINELVKYINTQALNVRSSKSFEDSSNIVKTLAAGEKISGTVDGEWFKTNDGYVKLAYLSDSYPQDLIDSLNNKNKQEEAPEVQEANTEIQTEEVVEEKAANTEAQVEEVVETNEASEQVQEEVIPEVKGQAFTGWVYNTNVLNVRDKAVSGNIVGTLNKGTKVTGEIADGWVKFDFNGKTSYVSSSYLTTEEVKEEAKAPVEEVKDQQEVAVEQAQKPAVNNNGVSAANIAGQFVGYPYVWGSSNPSVGFDCSGLVVNTYRQLGVSLPHSSAAQFNTGYAVDYNSLQPGDLIFFAIKGGGIDHVGIITSSDGTFIHASTPRSGVRYDNVYNSYYQNTFRGARRIF
ncbi:NlpC/P60 family protein [Anaerococcus sp. Marseille-Q7828]|uniref:NlpC/P60 family protein n=1 Tax=Anaerococcus sp. Marseille-Q7828 TaxID=3036300 RepID=UPI0024ACB8DB|nr:NlpC/P60 family protein [Anaerococcus sp. Marseille-Q7828]